MVHRGIIDFPGVVLFFCLSATALAAQQPDAASLRRYSQEGQKALAEKRFADAEIAYEKAVQLDPRVAELHANLGLTLFQEGKFERAVPSLRQALKLKPALPNAEYFLAVSLSELGHFQESLPGLEKGFARARDSGLKRLAGLHLERAYTGLRRDADAVGIAVELTRLFPKDPEILYETGRLCGNFAYLAMQKLADVAPDSVWRHQAAGELFETQAHYELADREYRAILALDPRRFGIHFRLGRALQLRAQETKSSAEAVKGEMDALKEFEQELELDPTNANAAYEAGEIHRKSGQFPQARELFESALKYYPDFTEAHVGLARVLASIGKPDLALAHLQRAISLNPSDEVAFYLLAQNYKSLGNLAEQQKALAEFRRLQSVQESHQEALTSSPAVTKQELDSQAKP